MGLPPVAKKPCSQCPWRRSHPSGWLGPLSAQEWIAIVHSDEVIACHLTIDEPADLKPGEERPEENTFSSQCAGAAQFRTNVFKSPRDREVARAAERNDKEIFGTGGEFLAHHVRS